MKDVAHLAFDILQLSEMLVVSNIICLVKFARQKHKHGSGAGLFTDVTMCSENDMQTASEACNQEHATIMVLGYGSSCNECAKRNSASSPERSKLETQQSYNVMT